MEAGQATRVCLVKMAAVAKNPARIRFAGARVAK